MTVLKRQFLKTPLENNNLVFKAPFYNTSWCLTVSGPETLKAQPYEVGSDFGSCLLQERRAKRTGAWPEALLGFRV